ncbi:calmodulin-like [Dendronephthya gigantea]|uniref:calmodulin-like n=1 Tax=Dendronephthya gigantea TaxID=151771 RepID=UPI00106D17C3|nr:calmodulin-like [Dendronephthya gigantea]
MAGKFTDQELLEYWQAFSVFDVDGDGTISTEELGNVMKSLGQNLTQEEIQTMIREIDTDGNGTVDFNEFLSLIVPTQKESPQNNLLDAFRAFDVNGDGYISRDELKEGLHILGEMVTDVELNELINKIDSDNDGQIRYAGLTNTYFLQQYA